MPGQITAPWESGTDNSNMSDKAPIQFPNRVHNYVDTEPPQSTNTRDLSGYREAIGNLSEDLVDLQDGLETLREYHTEGLSGFRSADGEDD